MYVMLLFAFIAEPVIVYEDAYNMSMMYSFGISDQYIAYADYQNSRVIVHDRKTYKHQLTFGQQGKGPKDFDGLRFVRVLNTGFEVEDENGWKITNFKGEIQKTIAKGEGFAQWWALTPYGEVAIVDGVSTRNPGPARMWFRDNGRNHELFRKQLPRSETRKHWFSGKIGIVPEDFGLLMFWLPDSPYVFVIYSNEDLIYRINLATEKTDILELELPTIPMTEAYAKQRFEEKVAAGRYPRRRKPVQVKQDFFPPIRSWWIGADRQVTVFTNGPTAERRQIIAIDANLKRQTPTFQSEEELLRTLSIEDDHRLMLGLVEDRLAIYRVPTAQIPQYMKDQLAREAAER